MKALYTPLLLVLILTACTSSQERASTDYTQYVNPFIGTDFTGNTYPGAQAPFGMVQLSPDNGLPGWDRISGYFYPDSTIAGFSHTHLSGTGAGDLYDISFMPVTLPYKEAEAPLGIHSKFSHDDESATAGYYRVLLKDYNIHVELTATERCGIQRYTFPEARAAIFLNLKKAMNWDFTNDTQVEIVDSVTIQGYRFSDGWARDQHIYFRTRFSKPFTSVQIDTTAIIKDGDHIGTATIARFDFDTQKDEQIIVSTAISGVSTEGAAKNLLAEVPDDNFDKYRNLTRDNWNRQLSKIEIVSNNTDDKVNFYTALYHSMIAPTIYSDVDGTYYGPDKKTHKTDGWVNYSTFSLWDTFRAAHPLFTYTEPERANDMVKSFIAFYEQNKRLPVWNFYGSETDMMIGYHAVPVIVDAYLKGITDVDPEKALEACIATANIDNYRGIGMYKKLGYVPYNIADSYNAENWSLSKTLEYAYDDYCIAKMAEKMGKKEIADEFYKRSLNYKNLYNPATSFMQPKDDKGNFIKNFSPDEYTPHICESNGWQYFWSVQQDIDGLIALTGGKERFAQKLDSMFTYHPSADDELPIFSTGMIGQYAHGNEPSHHVIYLYNAVEQPWKTQQYAAKVMHELYQNSPAGLCGNEDCGQMSAWYVFSAMGFYPVDPVSGKYEIGTPLFPEMQMHLSNGNTFTVLAPTVSKENIYIQAVKFDGKPYSKSYITHEQIMEGATLEFEMGNTPGPVWYK
ncbi:glycoside hydrolase family 92 protein [Bacteroides nordii]|jgi:putative alpha-1,2-mannosidase|uniref:Glycoside hydrolase family 92 protein n=2 Tax=Bacteroides nordii TaxID=291645 RepID=A0A413VVD1_9BACE|nr:GH92 family glycosyl hydrolase [Bacteroides nordii]OKZ06381.1 MAG: alpha-mannosidase [Bacteroides sp. 41_26]RHB37580.1 glycoside hydrolase family 92 protein [Bacteroides nordii]